MLLRISLSFRLFESFERILFSGSPAASASPFNPGERRRIHHVQSSFAPRPVARIR